MHLQSETRLFVHNKQLIAPSSTTESLAEKLVPTKSIQTNTQDYTAS